jgi:hypothetical protein
MMWRFNAVDHRFSERENYIVFRCEFKMRAASFDPRALQAVFPRQYVRQC